MTLSRSFALLAALGVCWVAAAGCSDDTPGNTGDASVPDSGTGGSGAAGAGGKVQTGGSSGRAGMPGAGGAGVGGAGKGGSVNGGSTSGPDASMDAGNGGSSGPDASTGGASTGGAGGASAGGAGGGSSGAVSGAGGRDASADASEGGVLDASDGASTARSKTCAYHCSIDTDCKAGTDTSKVCDPVSKHCVDPAGACKTHEDCIPLNSFWSLPCSSDDDCFPGDVCVDINGSGLCATPPDDVVGCIVPPDTVVKRRFGDSGDAGTVTVCADLSGRCDAGQCIFGCAGDPTLCSAAGGFGSTCNAETGKCECAASTECTASGVSTCNTGSHLCECATNADCVGTGTDVCVAGRCGCSAASVCPASLFANAPPVCE